MAVFNGKKMLVIVDGVTIAATKSFTLTVDVDLPDATTKDDDAWGNSIYGAKSWNVTVDGLYDPSATFGIEEIYDMIDNETTAYLEMAVIDGTGGGLCFAGNANSTGFALTADLNAPVTMSGGFKHAGKLNKGTVASS